MHWIFENMRSTDLSFFFFCVEVLIRNEHTLLDAAPTVSFFSFILLLWLLHCSRCLACLFVEMLIWIKMPRFVWRPARQKELGKWQGDPLTQLSEISSFGQFQIHKQEDQVHRKVESQLWIFATDRVTSYGFAAFCSPFKNLKHSIYVECIYVKKGRYRTQEPCVAMCWNSRQRYDASAPSNLCLDAFDIHLLLTSCSYDPLDIYTNVGLYQHQHHLELALLPSMKYDNRHESGCDAPSFSREFYFILPIASFLHHFSLTVSAVSTRFTDRSWRCGHRSLTCWTWRRR